MKTIQQLQQDGILKPHNIRTYQEMQVYFDCGETRVGVVQATGTGKSYLALQYLYDQVLSNPNSGKAAILTPLYGIVDQFKVLLDKECKRLNVQSKNVDVLNYEQIRTKSDEEIAALHYDYIVLDEFHGLGATGRGDATQKLLQANPDAKILGITATPIRYLDKMRDMGDELFGDNIVRGLNVTRAIEQGVLPTPDYVMAVYSYDETIAGLQEKIDKIKDKKQREVFQRDLDKLRHRAETAEGIKQVFERKITNTKGKFIAFCPNMQRLDSLKDEIRKGLFAGVNKKVKIYTLTHLVKDPANVISQFEQDDSDSLKVMLAIDMFNEGIHINGVDGCFMFRPTVSPRIYLQQMGRVLDVRENAQNFSPLIFDVVNNIRCLDQVAQAFGAEKQGYGYSERSYAQDDIFDDIPFKIDGNDLELNQLLISLDNSVSRILASKQEWLDAAARYCEKYGDLDMPGAYKDEQTDLQVGYWLRYIRGKYNEDPHSVDKVIAKKLISLDEDVFNYSKANYVEQRNSKILSQLKKFTKENGQVPVPSQRKIDSNDEFALLKKQCRQIKLYLNGLGSSKYDDKFIEQILKINPKALQFKVEAKQERDAQLIEELKAFTKEYGEIAVPSTLNQKFGEKFANLRLHCSLIVQQLRGYAKSRAYSQELIDQLLAINPNALSGKTFGLEQRNEQILEELKIFTEKYGQVPVPSAVNMGVSKNDRQYDTLIIQCKMIRQCLQGTGSAKYDSEFIDQILKINPNALKTREELVAERHAQELEELRQFTNEFGQIPVPSPRKRDRDKDKYNIIKCRCKDIRAFFRGNGLAHYSQEFLDQMLAINPNAFKAGQDNVEQTQNVDGEKSNKQNQLGEDE